MSRSSTQSRPHRCPVCRTAVWSFVPCGQDAVPERQGSIVSNGTRHGCRCPTCGARERHRLLWIYLRLNELLADARRVLHFAPNRGLYDRLGDDQCVRWLPVDARRPESDAFLDVQRLPFASDSFDVAICSHVLEHVEDDVQALSELRRVLTASGYALLLVPLDWSCETIAAADADEATRRKRFGQADHVRLYGCDFEDRLSRAGLDVETSSVPATLTATERFKYGVNDKESFFVCRPTDDRVAE